LWTRGLLIRRTITDQDLAFFSTGCPAGTLMETLVRVEGHRWAIEDALERSHGEPRDEEHEIVGSGHQGLCASGGS
jgi:SRSO17 transposase